VYLLADSLEEGEYTLPPGPVFLFPNSVMDALKAEVRVHYNYYNCYPVRVGKYSYFSELCFWRPKNRSNTFQSYNLMMGSKERPQGENHRVKKCRNQNNFFITNGSQILFWVLAPFGTLFYGDLWICKLIVNDASIRGFCWQKRNDDLFSLDPRIIIKINPLKQNHPTRKWRERV
jgi:hypothetical protein